MKFSSVKASTNNSSPPPRVVNPRARLNRGRGHFFFAFLALVPGSGCGSSNSRLITRIPRTIAAGKRCASDRAAASLTRSPPGNHPPTLSLFFFFFLPFLSLCTYSSFPAARSSTTRAFLKRWRRTGWPRFRGWKRIGIVAEGSSIPFSFLWEKESIVLVIHSL